MFIIKRCLDSLIVLFIVMTILFIGLHGMGNPVTLFVGPEAEPTEIEAITETLRLNRPLYEQYIEFIGNLIQLDFGKSFLYQQPVWELIVSRLSATIELALFALILSLSIGAPFGIYCALYPNGVLRKIFDFLSVLVFSLPNFWQALILICFFSLFLNWFPASGRYESVGQNFTFWSMEGIRYLFLPALNLALFKIFLTYRMIQKGITELKQENFIYFAKFRKISKVRLFFVYYLRHLLIPVITIIIMEFGALIAFAAITESIFSWPGIGKLLIDSILRLDHPVILGYLFLTTVFFISLNLICDLLYALIDPRLRSV